MLDFVLQGVVGVGERNGAGQFKKDMCFGGC